MPGERRFNVVLFLGAELSIGVRQFEEQGTRRNPDGIGG